MAFKIFILEDKVDIHTLVPEEDFPELLLNKLEKFIAEKSYIHNYTRLENTIKFTAPPFRFVWNGWNLFNPVTKAELMLKHTTAGYALYYRFAFYEFAFYAVLFSLLVLFPVLDKLQWKAIYLAVVWILYFFNVLWPKPRFEKLINDIVKDLDIAYLEKLKKIKGNAEG